jgi:hypothetical protein
VAGGPPLTILACTIPAEGPPSLRSLQGWAALLRVRFDFVVDTRSKAWRGISDSRPSPRTRRTGHPAVVMMPEGSKAWATRPAKRLPLHTPTQDAVNLPKMVQVVCRFQADELLDRLPSAYLVDPIALHPPCARDRLQQSQVAIAQPPERPLPKASHLAACNPSTPPIRPDPPR